MKKVVCAIGNKGEYKGKIIDEVEITKFIENKIEFKGKFTGVEGESVIIIEVVDSFDIVEVSAIEVVDNFNIVVYSVLEVVDNSNIVEYFVIKVVDNCDIVVGGISKEIEIIVIYIKVEIKFKSGIEVIIVDSFSVSNKVVKEIGKVDSNNIVFSKGKVVTIISFSILKPNTSSILVLKFSEIVNKFNS